MCGLEELFSCCVIVLNTHLTLFCCLNVFLSPDVEYCTDSYILIQYFSKIEIRLVRSTYVLYNNKYLRTYFMTILPHRNCTSSYKSDKIVRFSVLVGILEILKKSLSWPKIIFRQTLKVETYSNNQGGSKNAMKRVVVLILLQDMVFEESL